MASNSEYEQQRTWHLGQYLPIHPSNKTDKPNWEGLAFDAKDEAEAYLKLERDKWFSADKKQNK